MWTLINNVTVAEDGRMQCSWPDGNITYSLQLLGPVVHTYGPSMRVHQARGAVADPLSPESIVLGHADASSNHSTDDAAEDPDLPYDGGVAAEGSPPLAKLYALSFGYVPSMFQLPVSAQDKFVQIQNITLNELPQMAPGRALRGFRRRLQQRQLDDSVPIGIWTILLWPFRR